MQKKFDLFREFFKSEKAAGFLLLGCTVVSLLLSNTGSGERINEFLHSYLDLSFPGIDLKYSIEHWINDGLMAVFFLLIGLEIERELYIGELSSFKNALLPILAAIGGMLFPAFIHLIFNGGTETQAGFGIPMATDIAFALGILSLAGNRVPVSLKIFLTALAIIDDLGAITVIAVFYTKGFSLAFFIASLLVFGLLFILVKLKVYALWIYLLGGIVMWYLMLKSGVHATIAGVLLAFAIPFHKDDSKSPSYKLQHSLHNIVAFGIIPVFALANTAIIFPKDIFNRLLQNNSLGIILGLLAGKVTGIMFMVFIAVKLKWVSLSAHISWKNLFAVSLLAGIGFTMSIFITTLAFEDPELITSSKISILIASLIAGGGGLMLLKQSVAKKNLTG